MANTNNSGFFYKTGEVERNQYVNPGIKLWILKGNSAYIVMHQK